IRKPLVIFTPKSLLRHPKASSSLDELAGGHFQELLNATDFLMKDRVTRVIMASGKICYDLLESVTEKQIEDTAILKLEQLYPFPRSLFKKEFKKYPNATEFTWVQEEP